MVSYQWFLSKFILETCLDHWHKITLKKLINIERAKLEIISVGHNLQDKKPPV